MKLSTNRNIEVIQNKVLKLSKVLLKQLTHEEMSEMNKSLMIIQGAIKARGLKNIGPLITHNKSELEDGILMPVVTIITQLQEPPHGKVDSLYSYKENLRIEKCLYAKFIGDERNMQIPIMKMQVYAYENNLHLKGDYYSVLLGNDEKVITADFFMEVVSE